MRHYETPADPAPNWPESATVLTHYEMWRGVTG